MKSKKENLSPNQNFKPVMSEPHSPTLKEGFVDEDTGDDCPEGTLKIVDRGIDKKPLLFIKPLGIEKNVQSNFCLLEDNRNGIHIQLQDKARASSELLGLAQFCRRQIVKENNKNLNSVLKQKKKFYCG